MPSTNVFRDDDHSEATVQTVYRTVTGYIGIAMHGIVLS